MTEAGYFEKGRWIPVKMVCGTCGLLRPYFGRKPIPNLDGYCGRLADSRFPEVYGGTFVDETCNHWQWNGVR